MPSLHNLVLDALSKLVFVTFFHLWQLCWAQSLMELLLRVTKLDSVFATIPSLALWTDFPCRGQECHARFHQAQSLMSLPYECHGS
jgi:hypothetical protein